LARVSELSTWRNFSKICSRSKAAMLANNFDQPASGVTLFRALCRCNWVADRYGDSFSALPGAVFRILART
jgi:hypothetical protein